MPASDQHDRGQPESTRQRQRGKIESPGIHLNFTAMIDVIFQLLIYFVVTASFTIDEGALTARLPEGTGLAPALPKLPQRPITIRLSPVAGAPAQCHIELVGLIRQVGDFGELAAHLARIQFSGRNPDGAFKPDNPLIIEPGDKLAWQHVVNGLNAAIKAGYSNISFARAFGS